MLEDRLQNGLRKTEFYRMLDKLKFYPEEEIKFVIFYEIKNKQYNKIYKTIVFKKTEIQNTKTPLLTNEQHNQLKNELTQLTIPFYTIYA